MPTEQENFMAQALALAAEAAAVGEVPVGCVIVRDGKSWAGAATGGRRSRPPPPCGDGGHCPGQRAPRHLAAG